MYTMEMCTIETNLRQNSPIIHILHVFLFASCLLVPCSMLHTLHGGNLPLLSHILLPKEEDDETLGTMCVSLALSLG